MINIGIIAEVLARLHDAKNRQNLKSIQAFAAATAEVTACAQEVRHLHLLSTAHIQKAIFLKNGTADFNSLGLSNKRFRSWIAPASLSRSNLIR